MKKLLIVFAALVMSLLMTVCFAEEAPDGPVGMPNPIVEYDSLEEINSLIGVSLMRPAVMGVTDERFSVIGGTIAQYDCGINGLEWTFRAAYITDEDISGIYHEYNEFTPDQDSGVYANEFYLERFFDGDRQYTIVVMNPISGDGDVYLDQETFSNICMEFESIQKQHMDDPLVGDYMDTVSQRAEACVERLGDVYNISVTWADSESEITCWTVYGAVREENRLSYQGEEIGHYTYDEEGSEITAVTTAANNLGWFEINDGLLYWTGAAQEECRTCVFKKIVYEE